ncbi:expressed unknown protein [Seminavis robusta]|uniref:Uncharacterized protein n=1 Tax=Seminavis robusta TaxID=568900 RepID=A0A9N8DJL9_9STRA|nr:expressed unknown protein [Seminavis robusta]|eukprot:Sro194_g082870.1 n/a (270) ;mRNA; r:51734-52543
MTVAAIQAPMVSLASTACNNEPLFSLFSGDSSEVSITISNSAASFDWSDFPVVYQYNEDMPVPSGGCTESPQLYYSSPQCSTTKKNICSKLSPMTTAPTMPWELERELDDTNSLSMSSDDETVATDSQVEDSSANRRADRESVIKFSPFVEIRSHAVVLGDHPCCNSLALELAWEHQEVQVLDFDLYESSRQSQRRKLRSLRLSYWERRMLLERSTGLSEHELLLQEQRAWGEQLDREAANRDKAPSMPCSSSILKKVSSTKTLSSMDI